MKTKIGTELAHITCGSDTTFKVKGHGQRGGAYCGGLPHSLLQAGLLQTGKLPVSNLIRGLKSAFSPCRTESLHQFMYNLARGFAWPSEILSQSVHGGGYAVPKCLKNRLLLMIHPVLANLLDMTDFYNYLGAFMQLITLHKCLKFDLEEHQRMPGGPRRPEPAVDLTALCI